MQKLKRSRRRGIDYAAVAAAGGLSKGPTRHARKAERKAEHRSVVADVRAEVFALDPVCVVCLGPPTDGDAMHEVMSRAQTRGLSESMRFNRRNCVRVHDGVGYDCHRKITGDLGGRKTTMAFLDPGAGVDGGLIIRRHGHEAVVYRRRPKPRHERYDGEMR